MRSDRLALAAAVTLVGLAASSGCREPQPPTAEAVPERFAGVRKGVASPATAQGTFCDKSYPAGGERARRYSAPPQRPLPGSTDTGDSAGSSSGAWTWVNLWATWCAPCIEELEVLGRWRDGFSRDALHVRFELVSIDADPEREKDLVAWRSKRLPGPIRWLRSDKDLEPLLDSLGVERDAMIPVHALVDPSGWLRCVRIGAIHEQDYAAVKALLTR